MIFLCAIRAKRIAGEAIFWVVWGGGAPPGIVERCGTTKLFTQVICSIRQGSINIIWKATHI